MLLPLTTASIGRLQLTVGTTFPMLQPMGESIHSLYLFCNLMIADITLNCKSKCINSHTSFASLFHFSIFYFLPFVEDAQCQQHGAVEQHAYGKYKLKITPLRIGCGAKAQHAQMPQPVGNGNRNCPLYAAADMLPPTKDEPHASENQKQRNIEQQPISK